MMQRRRYRGSWCLQIRAASENVFHNQALMSAAAACLFAQGLKPFSAAAQGQGFNWKLIIKSGGMPSSHSAVVTALATAICYERGAADPSFALALVFALVTMYDAQGVRRAAGKQAEVINTLVVPKLARPAVVARARHLSPSRAAEEPLPSSSAIGVELSRNSVGADLEFMKWRAAAPPAHEPASSAPAIGPQLATSAVAADLAFRQNAEAAGAPASPPGAAPFAAATATAAPLRSDTSGYISPPPAGRQLGDGNGASAAGGVEGELQANRFDRSKRFWEAAASEPSMVGGEVEVQELHKLEGWRHIPLKESVGHTKLEVLVGAAAGVLLATWIEQVGLFRA